MLFSTKRSLLCISTISCMSLYASIIEVDSDITIGKTTTGKEVATDLENKADYNYWLGKTYVFNRDKDKNGKYWIATNTVTIDKDYTLNLTTIGYFYNDYVLKCWNTFTNNGNVIIDDYGVLGINSHYTSINNGAIYINNGALGLFGSTLTTTGTITLTDSSSIDIRNNSTLNNTGTIDISNITDLSEWYNDNIFTLEGGSTFILPKSITNKIKTSKWINPITLNGTDNKPVNIVIPEDCKYITDIDNNNKDALFSIIQEETGFTFGENKDNVKFSWQTDDVKQTTETSVDNECEYVDEC